MKFVLFMRRFSGTIRFNLDPFNEHKDDELWDALEKVYLADYVRQNCDPHGLSFLVSVSGSNFSQGQKQLICIGR